jgi:ATP-dependent exoDNAse (exonuclease V) beta subunit
MLRIIKASAGSGKTYTLVKEYLKIALAAPAEKYRHILAITFTNKAANEMKERIISALEELALVTGDDHELFNFLQDEVNLTRAELKDAVAQLLSNILHNYGDLAVSTIDSFTHRVIRGFAYELQLPMSVEIEMDTEKLLQEVIDLLLDDIDNTESETTKAIIDFAQTRLQDGKSFKIKAELIKFSKELLQDETFLRKDILQNTEMQQLLDLRSDLYKSTAAFENKCTGIAKHALGAIQQAGINPEELANGKRNGLYGYFATIARGTFSYDNLTGSGIHWGIIEKNKWHSTNASPAAIAAIDSVKAILEQDFRTLTGIFENEARQYFLHKLILKNIFQFTLLKAVNQVLQQYKADNEIMLISEFQHMVHDEVKDQPTPVIYERVGSRFEHIMIDEFQDTSVLQWHNLLPLIDNSLSNGFESLIVGDAKQAIYRFRGGEVSQFAALPHIIGSDTNMTLKEREIAIFNHGYSTETLPENYRSRNEIIRFNNAFYESAKTYRALTDEAIYHEHGQQSGKDIPGGYIEINFIDEEESENKYEQRFKEIVNIIERCRQKGYAWKDIAILSSTNKTGSAIASYLLEHNIDVVSRESLLIDANAGVQLLLSLMRYLNHVKDYIARSEILLHIQQHMNKDAVVNHEKIHCPTADFEKYVSGLCGRSFDSYRLSQYKLFALQVELISMFSIEEQPNPFVQFFLDEVLDTESKYNFNISQFLEWWEEEKDKKSILYPDTLDAVKLLTLHRSKGLQFPVVILADADMDVKSNKNNVWIDFDPALPHGVQALMVPMQKALEKTDYAALYGKEQQDAYLDKLNLMYVGTTRPKDMMFILSSPIPDKSAGKEGGNMRQLLQHFLAGRGLWNGNGVYSLGDEHTVRIARKDTHGTATISIQKPEKGKEIQLPTIKTDSRLFWKQSTLDKINYGNLLHSIIAEIAYEQEAAAKIHALTDSLVLDTAASESLKRDVLQIIRHPQLKEYFNLPYKVLNEREITSAGGELMKPDRVVIHPVTNTAVIIDFKTGGETTSHEKQVEQYAAVLRELGYTVEKKLIVYTGHNHVAEIL